MLNPYCFIQDVLQCSRCSFKPDVATSLYIRSTTQPETCHLYFLYYFYSKFLLLLIVNCRKCLQSAQVSVSQPVYHRFLKGVPPNFSVFKLNDFFLEKNEKCLFFYFLIQSIRLTNTFRKFYKSIEGDVTDYGYCCQLNFQKEKLQLFVQVYINILIVQLFGIDGQFYGLVFLLRWFERKYYFNHQILGIFQLESMDFQLFTQRNVKIIDLLDFTNIVFVLKQSIFCRDNF